MQFLESSVIGLRAAIYRFSSKSLELELLIFPMVHIGDPSYYRYIKTQLSNCDSVVFEGVKSKKTWFLVQSYKILQKKKSLGLELQSKALNIENMPIQKIHGDVTAEEFDKSWRQIPLWFRTIVLICAPLYGIYQYLVTDRTSLAKDHSVESVPLKNDIDESKESLKFDEAILHDRDSKLVEVLEDHIATHGNRSETTAIVYGARHIPAVVAFLSEKYGFKVTKSEWVQAI
jgi:hypothetical protein